MEQDEARTGVSFSILAVDDEPVVHEILQMLIKGIGLPVVLAATADSGRDAVKMAKALRPDICLLDINMEEMDGLQTARRIVEVLGYRPRIIYLTAHNRFEYAQEALRLGATDFLLKPVRREELHDTLKRAVNELQAERLEKLEESKLRERVQTVSPAAASTQGPARESRAAAVAREVKEYVDEHYAERISLSTVADRLCLCAGYLGPLFKAESGVSFRAYLRSVRVAHAKDLMRDHTLNLTQIAQAVGYDDQNYFSQVFLEETGVRPGEYRGGGRHWAR